RFFFSSRRRHTRFSRDWSSDVCSSDLSLMFKYFFASFFAAALWGFMAIPLRNLVEWPAEDILYYRIIISTLIIWPVIFLFRKKRSEEHTSELQSRENIVCRLLLEKKNY